MVLCEDVIGPDQDQQKARNTLRERLTDIGRERIGWGAEADPDTWGTSPEAMAAQEAMMRRSGMVGDDTDPPEGAP